MTINEMFIECFSKTPIGTQLSRSEIVHALQAKYTIKEYSILPSDLCYNSSNKGVEGKDTVKLFLKKGRGMYVYVGQDFDPQGVNPHEFGTINLDDICKSTQNGFGRFDSWIIQSERVAIKETDKSVFNHHESGIPKEIRWFFGAQNLSINEKIDISLVYEAVEYEAYITRESEYGRTRIFWHSNLSVVFSKIYDSRKCYPFLKFEKVDNFRYNISFHITDPLKLVEALDDSHTLEELEQQARDMDIESLRNAAKTRSKTNPDKKETLVKQIYRDPYISEYAKRRAKGVCQLCKQKAPFLDRNGKPYLESHHIVWLSNGGEDSINNTVALCPNCHKKMHIVDDPKDVDYLQKQMDLCELP